MIARQFFDDGIAAVVLKHDEMPDEIQKTALIEHAAQQNFKLRHGGGRDGFAVNGAPRHEAFLVRADGADARLQPVGNNQHGVVDEQRRNLLLVSLELCERLPDVGVFVRRIFQFNDAQRQAVDENHHVGAAVVLAFDHGELVHHEPVVIFRVGKINQPDDFRADAAVLAAAFDGDAVHQQPVKGAVVGDEGRMLRDGDFAKGFVQCLGGNFGFSFRNAARKRFRKNASPKDLRSAAGSPGARCGPKTVA